jgi:hypothetical protein
MLEEGFPSTASAVFYKGYNRSILLKNVESCGCIRNGKFSLS